MNQTQVTSRRFTIVNTDGYKVEIEYTEDFIIMHFPHSEKLTKSLYKEMRQHFEDFIAFVNTMGHQSVWASIDPEDKLTTKFASRLGFVKVGEADNMNVYERRI